MRAVLSTNYGTLDWQHGADKPFKLPRTLKVKAEATPIPVPMLHVAQLPVEASGNAAVVILIRSQLQAGLQDLRGPADLDQICMTSAKCLHGVTWDTIGSMKLFTLDSQGP